MPHRLIPCRAGATGSLPARLIGAHDALSARLGEEAGFDGIWLSGFEVCASHCVADDSSLPRGELLERAAEVTGVVDVPVLVDVDAGFGDAASAEQTAQLFARVGVAGIVIEDKLQHRNTFGEASFGLESVDRFCDKLRAARQGAERPLAVIARTESMSVAPSVRAALDRAHAYVDAGADAVVFHSRCRDGAEVLAALEAWGRRAPTGVIPTSYHRVPAAQLGQVGADFVIYANYGVRAAVRAMQAVLARVWAQGSAEDVEPFVVPMKEIFRLQEASAARAARAVASADAQDEPPPVLVASAS